MSQITQQRIVVLDPHPLVRTGVKQSLLQGGAAEVVGEAADGRLGLELIAHLKPDLVIMELFVPGVTAAEIVSKAVATHPDIKFLILSSRADAESLKPIRSLPISGFVLKDESPDQLLQALRAIAQGAVWFTSSVAPLFLNQNREGTKIRLTPREVEVLELVREGKDNAFIAKTLCLTDQTIRNYCYLIYEKIGVTTRTEALIWAREQEFERR